MAKKHFVAVTQFGIPVAQRSTDRVYNSASKTGGSFSAKAPNPDYPLHVVQVDKALVWKGVAHMTDGSTYKTDSKSGPLPRFAVVTAYTQKGYPEQEPRVSHADSVPEAYSQEHGSLRVVAWGEINQELKNWNPPA